MAAALVTAAAWLVPAPALAAIPVFENGTPAGFSPVDGQARTEFVAGNEVFVRVDLNQAATYEHPVIGHFHSLERSEQLSAVDTDGLQIDIAMIDVVPFGTGANLPAPGVTQVASVSPVIHTAWVEQTGYSAGSVYNGGITPVYQVRYAHSYDLGRTFSAPVSVCGAITYHPLTALANGPFASLDLEVDSGGRPRVAYAFVSTADRARNGNVYLAYSHDDGQTWETPLVVNDLATAGTREGRRCAFPRLAIDDRDNVFIAYVRGVSAGAGTDDVMLARVDRTATPFTMVAVGSLGTVGSSGGVRLTPDAGRQIGPDVAVGDGDALHVVYFSDGDDQIHHKRLATDQSWATAGAAGWNQNAGGAVVGSFVDELANAALEQEARHVFPTVVVDRQRLPDRVYGLYKGGSGAAESVYFSHYDDDGTQGSGAAWGTATPVWSTGGTPLFRDGNQAYGVELDWTVTERVAAVVDQRLDDRGDLHIAFTAGYSNTAAGGEHDVYFATYNGASWTLPEKVADDDSDGALTEDGIAAADRYLLSPALAAHPDTDDLYLAFGGGIAEGLGVKGVTNANQHPYFKVLGRSLSFADVSVPAGAHEYALAYTPVHPQAPAAVRPNRPVFVHAADPATGLGLGASGTSGAGGASTDGFLTGTWERVGTSLQDTGKRFEGQLDEAAGSDREWGDEGDKVGLLVKLNALGSDSATNLQVVTGSSASARSVHVAAAPPLGLAAGSYFALGADIDITAANDGPTVAVLQPDGSGDVANLSYVIQYVLDDPDDDLDTSLEAALYAYSSPGLRTVQDIRIFGTLIADQNDRTARNAAGTNDLEQGNGDYTWDEPPALLRSSALFASILRLPSGTYYVYLVADDGRNPPVFAVSPGAVTIVHSPVVRQIDPPTAETVDTGVRTGATANPYDLDFAVVDYDSEARVQLFYSAFAGLTSVSASGVYPNQSFALGRSLAGTRATPITAAASLGDRTREYAWDVTSPLVREGAYYLYAVATDSVSVAVGHSPARLTVRHSPSFIFYEPARNTQRAIDTGSQPVYTIQWQKGPGDGDLDDDASIALYYTSVDPAVKSYAGADSTDLVDPGDGDATLIAGPLQENGDGAADMYVWDFRAGGDVPPHGRQVWLYAVVSDPGGNAAVELGGSLTLRHSPYVLLKTRLPEINQGDVLRLEWEDYMIDDGSGTDDAYLRLYASQQPGLATLAQLEAELGSGTTWVINSGDGTAAGAWAVRESDANALSWDTRTSAFALPVGTYSVYAGISGDATFADNVSGRVGAAANQLSVRAATGAVPHVALSPNRVIASAGETLTFEVVMQSDGLAASALSIGIDLPPGAFAVLDPTSPFTDLGTVFAGGTVLEDTTIGGQLRFSKTGVSQVLGSQADPVAVASFAVVAQSLTGLQLIELSDQETAIGLDNRSVPLRRSTGMSALDIEDSIYGSANDDHPATADTVEVQTASDGQLLLESVPSGRYVLTAKDTSHLSGRTDTITVRPGESVRLTSELGLYASDIRGDPSFLLPQDGRLLQAGDATGDNEVDEDDINAIDAAWGTDPARPRFAEADLNNDGRVGVEDLTAAISNIGNTTGFGAPPVYRPAGGPGNAAARVEVVAPDHPGGWWPGTEADLVVRARDLQDLAGYSFDLAWDPAEMEIVKRPEGPRVGEVLAPNPAGRHGRVSEGTGTLSVAAARRGKAWSARGDGELLRLRVRLLGEGFPASLAVRDGVLLSSVYERTPIAVADPWRAALPAALALEQNYPNPFNPSTTIAFALPEGPLPAGMPTGLAGVPVQLEIYNVLGQLVRTLVDEPRRPGYHRVQWDGRDGRGHDVASGLYLYRLQAGAAARVGRMALVR